MQDRTITQEQPLSRSAELARLAQQQCEIARRLGTLGERKYRGLRDDALALAYMILAEVNPPQGRSSAA